MANRKRRKKSEIQSAAPAGAASVEIGRRLTSVVQEYESASQSLETAYEELRAANQQLRETNAELALSRSQHQKTIEELTAQNRALMRRDQELVADYEVLRHLLNSLSVPILLVGPDLRVGESTPAAEKFFRFSRENGRPLVSALTSEMRLPDLRSIVVEVLKTLEPQAHGVPNPHGSTLLLFARPYVGPERRIQGVVLLLVPAPIHAPAPVGGLEQIRLDTVIRELVPRIQAAAGPGTTVLLEKNSVPPPVRTNRPLLERLLLAAALASLETVPGPAQLGIEIYAIQADQQYCSEHPTVPPGDYVAVSLKAGPRAATAGQPTPAPWTIAGLKAPSQTRSALEGYLERLGAHCWASTSLGGVTNIVLYLPGTGVADEGQLRS